MTHNMYLHPNTYAVLWLVFNETDCFEFAAVTTFEMRGLVIVDGHVCEHYVYLN